WAYRPSHLQLQSSLSGPPVSSGSSTKVASLFHRTRPARCRPVRVALPAFALCPPRENGGNFDVKQLTKGAKLFLPVFQEGGLFSTGDGYFAQGDGEACVTAVEMGATAVVRFKIHKRLAGRRKFTAPVFSRQTYFADPRFAAPER